MSFRIVSLCLAVALLGALVSPAESAVIPGIDIIDSCTYSNSGCPTPPLPILPAPPIGNGFPINDVWSPYWNTASAYGPQLVTHTDLCNTAPEPITVIVGQNLVTCVNAQGPPSPGCPCPPTPEPIPIPLPSQLWYSTAFWDGSDGYILGGAIDLDGSETSAVTKFSRGMPQGPLYDPPYEPIQPGGVLQSAGSLPTARSNQGLAYDTAGNMAYLFAGTNGGELDNSIYSYTPVTQSSGTAPCVLPRNFDKMAGAWAEGAAYAFGGRYLEGNGDTVAFSLHTSNEIYKFDPSTCTVTLNPFNLPPNGAANPYTPDGKRFGMTAVTVGTEVFLFGGFFMDDVAGTTPTEVNSGAYAYNPLCGVAPPQPPYLPCTVPQCSILKFTPATGIVTTINPSFASLCGNMSAVYDGKYIFLFKGGSAYRYDPATPTIMPTFAASLPVGIGQPLKANDYSRGGTEGTSAIATGCSAYIFGGKVDFAVPPVTTAPDGPISDKITWFGKCRPTAVLAPTYGYTCPFYPIWFDARFSIVAEGDFKKVTWNWGDGTPSQTGWYFPHSPDWYDQYAFLPHTFTNEGNFVVTMTVEDFNGFKSSAQTTVPIRTDAVCTMYGGTPHTGATTITYPDSESLDSDLDGIPDVSDNCAGVANNDQVDEDADGVGDECTTAPVDEEKPVIQPAPPEVVMPDKDRDGIPDVRDNCRALPNHDQSDLDTDLAGDVCDVDIDGDGVSNSGPPGAFLDNCPWYANPDQLDSNGDGAGDECAFMEGAFAKPKAAGPAAAGDVAKPSSLPWAAATGMAIAAALGTVFLLMVLLRRTRRPE